MNSSIVIASQFVSGKQNSTGYYWSGIINKLAKDFSDVKVICSTLPEKNEKNNLVQYEEISSLSYEEKQSVRLIKRFFIEIKLSWQFFSYIRNSLKSGATVFTGTNPPILLLFLYILRQTKPFKWIILVHDVFPENLVVANIVKDTNIIYKLTRFVFNKVYSSSDNMIVIGRDMKVLMEKKTNNNVDVVYIPNWASVIDVKLIPRESSVYLKELNWIKYTVFQVFGNLGRLQDIPNILEAISLVKSKNAAFLFMGGGIMSETIEDFISKNRHLNISFFGAIDIENRSEALSACDVAIVSLLKGMKGLAVPSKAYFSLAADKPLLVVSDIGSELMTVVSDLDVGWFCESASPNHLANEIDAICDIGIPFTQGGIRTLFNDNFSDDIILNEISNYIKKCV